ncbi:DNA repair and recombination protein RAD54-like [Rhynchospora pubera]|uniref:DNA repair and recombination protein RAD54-like n=1 Tax=Rhynchospora pubera TaxID=906938 RepID=A0AAV8HI89_9POAL|nr:DNA repair and recombination protein RAD54-like [Rhynchospora pubera]
MASRTEEVDEEEEEKIDVSSDSDKSDGEEEADEDYEEEAGEEDSPSSDQDQERKSQNVADLVRGNLVVKRQPLIPRILSVSEAAAVARKPFKPPCGMGYRDHNEELARRLFARKRFVPWGSGQPLTPISNLLPQTPVVSSSGEDCLEKREELPPGVEPLILWQSEESDKENVNNLFIVEVDPLLVRYLRPHQREGVQFMFDCVSGLSSAEGISGCILADDMGLGKTLQSITLLYTLLRQGFDGKPIVKRALIVTPTSLVSNWESEIKKWLGGRVQLLSLCESTRADVLSGIASFLNPCSRFQVLIISYETFRIHSAKFESPNSCDLLICDEAHRLKNDQTLTNKALAALPCKRRILLSGTPMQNDLEEFFSMVNFSNPGILGDASYFRRYYEGPIISGREPTATPDEKKLGAERSTELSSKVNQFILRRTNTLLSNHLPPKIIEVVCCKLTPLQLTLYKHFIQSKNVRRLITEDAKQSTILACITNLKKLCNHPKLIYDVMKSKSSGTSGFDNCLQFFPPELFSGRSGAWTGGGGMWVELSGKMHVLARLLGHLRQRTDDRIVLVSNYTQTLDLFAQLCRERRYPYVRLDGTTSISKRQKLVNQFNDPSKDEFAFLLSSKAGGCGLNLIGGNRLVLFDPDWNPANDKQAAARVWRDGQKKRVYIYRFLSTGTIEEKVYQRQMSKEGLQKVIQQGNVDSEEKGNSLSREDLRDLFTFHEDIRSEIHENIKCTRCQDDNNIEEGDYSESDTITMSGDGDIGGFAEISGCLHKLKRYEKQIGTPLEEDLVSWGHHSDPSTVPDSILQSSAGEEISFVFTNQVDGKLVPVDSVPKCTAEKPLPQLKTQQSSFPVFHSSKSSSILQQPSIKVHSKLLRRPQNRPTLNKPITNCDNQSTPKRRHLSSDISDDDFV